MGAEGMWKRAAAVAGTAALVIGCVVASQSSLEGPISLLKYQLSDGQFNNLPGYNSNVQGLHSMRARAAFGAMDALENEAKHMNTPAVVRHASTNMEMAFSRLKALETFSDQLLHKKPSTVRHKVHRMEATRLREQTGAAGFRGRWKRTSEYKDPARTSTLAEVSKITMPSRHNPKPTKQSLDMLPHQAAKSSSRVSQVSSAAMNWQMQRGLPP
mmetsp:Transcript_13522/g.21129  ORF Transcript_13522/g.21129 Transcript_13522/m.21129 type:complete len:214 (+) Transcript_13522:128-769(+)